MLYICCKVVGREIKPNTLTIWYLIPAGQAIFVVSFPIISLWRGNLSQNTQHILT